MKAAATGAAKANGTPSKSPEESGQPHSMTTAQFAHLRELKQKAAYAAVQAGEDPEKVLQSLDAAEAGHFQGMMLKETSIAARALDNGDMDGVKKALSNLNYYLPNGQGMTFKTATADDVAKAAAANPNDQIKVGDLMYRNPFFGMYGHQGPNEQQFVGVTPMHLQAIGQELMRPGTGSEAMMGQYRAGMEAQTNALKAQGEYLQGKGRADFGSANLQNADTNAKLAGGKDFLNRMSGVAKEKEAEMWAAKAGQEKQGGQFKVTEADYNRLGQEAIAGVRGNVQGKLRTPPAMIPDPNDPTGKTMIPNMSPGAGKPAPSGEAIPSLYQGMSANTQNKVENLSAQIAGSNVGLVNPQEAGDIAARVIRFDEGGGKGKHMNPVNHKVEPDVILDPAGNSLHVWTGNGYKAVWASPNLDRSSGKESALPTGSAPPTAAGNEAPPADMAS
jgi:hypothetical protein